MVSGKIMRPLKRVFTNKEQLELSELIKKRRWTTVMKNLPLGCLPSQSNESILHEVCRFRPPLKVVKKITKMNPNLVHSVNAQGRLPLHIAVENGSSLEIIEYLCELNPTAAGLQDLLGKTPLHLVEYNRRDFTLMQIVETLIESSPENVNLEDLSGMSALEYALVDDADRDVIKLLQRSSVAEWRKRASRGEKNTFIVNNMQKQYIERISSLRKDMEVSTKPTTSLIVGRPLPRRSLVERKSYSALSA